MTYFACFLFRHLARAAFRAASLRSLFVRVLALALPPLRPPNRPRETAAGFLVAPPETDSFDGCSFADSLADVVAGLLVESPETASSDGSLFADPLADVVVGLSVEPLETDSSGDCSFAA